MTFLVVDKLTKSFGGHIVVDGVSFTIEENTSTALIGPNGAGKTTTLSMLTGLLKPTSGTITTNGIKNRLSIIGFLPQYPQYFSWLTALEYTEMAAQLSGVEKRNAKKASEQMLDFVGLGNALHKKVGTFSGGMKQRLGIAQALVHKPKLLLLDEPVSALDPVGRREIMDLLKELRNDMTILYSTHILNDAEEMTDQLLFLQDGKLVESGSLQTIRKKYEEPKYSIQFQTENDALQFAGQSDLLVTVEGTNVIVEIVDEQPTMKQILDRLANCPYTVQRVERVTANLEEIFMKVTKT